MKITAKASKWYGGSICVEGGNTHITESSLDEKGIIELREQLLEAYYDLGNNLESCSTPDEQKYKSAFEEILDRISEISEGDISQGDIITKICFDIEEIINDVI